MNHNWVLGGAKLNEFIFQYADFANAITANSLDPAQTFPNNVSIGQNINTPQATQQHKWQFRDDFSWHMAGMGGLGHDFKTGVNFINEPHLFLTFNTGTGGYSYTHLDNDVNGPLSSVSLNGGSAEANTPMKQYAMYIQDDWRVSNKLTLNLGFRYDLITGMAIDQSLNPNFVILDKAGKAGALAGIAGFEDFGKTPTEDKNNFQPRAGLCLRSEGQRQGCHPRWMGPLLRFRLHQREHPLRGRERDRNRRRHGLLREQLERDQEPGRQLLQGERSDQQHRSR